MLQPRFGESSWSRFWWRGSIWSLQGINREGSAIARDRRHERHLERPPDLTFKRRRLDRKLFGVFALVMHLTLNFQLSRTVRPHPIHTLTHCGLRYTRRVFPHDFRYVQRPVIDSERDVGSLYPRTTVAGGEKYSSTKCPYDPKMRTPTGKVRLSRSSSDSEFSRLKRSYRDGILKHGRSVNDGRSG